jgi:hypothetical protein
VEMAVFEWPRLQYHEFYDCVFFLIVPGVEWGYLELIGMTLSVLQEE